MHTVTELLANELAERDRKLFVRIATLEAALRDILKTCDKETGPRGLADYLEMIARKALVEK